jgi:hypothetical protein
VVHLQRGDALEIAACVVPDRRGGVEAGSGQQLPVWGPGAGPHGAVVRLLKHILIETNRTDENQANRSEIPSSKAHRVETKRSSAYRAAPGAVGGALPDPDGFVAAAGGEDRAGSGARGGVPRERPHAVGVAREAVGLVQLSRYDFGGGGRGFLHIGSRAPAILGFWRCPVYGLAGAERRSKCEAAKWGIRVSHREGGYSSRLTAKKRDSRQVGVRRAWWPRSRPCAATKSTPYLSNILRRALQRALKSGALKIFRRRIEKNIFSMRVPKLGERD